MVRELLPNGPGEPIAGARIEILYKTEAGGSVISGADGTYRIDALTSPNVQLRVTKDAYESTIHAVVEPLVSDITVDLALRPIAHTLVGVVSETFPTETTPIGGAKVEILSGSNQSRTTTTDGNGYYSLSGVWGEFDLAFSADGFERRVSHVEVVLTDSRHDMSLLPDEQRVKTRFDGLVGYSAGQQKHHALPVHRAGDWIVEAWFTLTGDHGGNKLSLEVRCRDAMIASRTFPEGHFDETHTKFSVRAPGACEFEVKVFNPIGLGPTFYTVDIEHPK